MKGRMQLYLEEYQLFLVYLIFRNYKYVFTGRREEGKNGRGL